MFVNFLISIAINAVIGYLTFKPPKIKRYTGSDFDTHSATEDRPQALIFGTERVSGNIIYFGNVTSRPVKQSQTVGFFFSKSVTIGYEYFGTKWLTLAAVPCDSVHEIWKGERLVWKGDLPLNKNGKTELDLDVRWASAQGEDLMDGVKGKFTFWNIRKPAGPYADDTSHRNTLIEGLVDGPVPVYPNTLHATYNGLLSVSNQLEPFRFVVRRMPDLSHLGGGAPSGPTPGINGDANPAHIELEALTSPYLLGGSQMRSGAINMNAYLAAAAQLQAEGIGMSFNWDSGRKFPELLEQLAKVSVSLRDTEADSGRLRIRLLRPTDPVMHNFGPDNIIALQSFTRHDTSQAANVVQVPFIEREAGWLERVATAKSAAGVHLAGRQLDTTFDALGITRPEVAQFLAEREVRRFGASIATAEIVASLPFGTLAAPGDVCSFTHPIYGFVLRMRVITARFQDGQSGTECHLKLAEDTIRDGSGWRITRMPNAPVVPGHGNQTILSPLLELAPYALTGQERDMLLYTGLDPAEGVDLYSAAHQPGTTWNANADATYSETNAEPAIAGVLQANVASTAERPSMSFAISTSGYQQWLQGARGALTFTMGDEWLGSEDWGVSGNAASGYVLTANNVARGIYDTVPRAHLAGDSARIRLGQVLVPSLLRTQTPWTTYEGATALVVRAETRAVTGVTRPNDAPTSQATWTHNPAVFRAARPLPPRRPVIAGVRGSTDSTETPPALARPVGSVTVSWRLRNRGNRTWGPFWDDQNSVPPGVSVRCELEAFDNGAWVACGSSVEAPGATQAVISMALVPATATLLRARLTSLGDAESVPYHATWSLT